MLLVCVAVLIVTCSAFFHIKSKQQSAAERYAVAFAQWEAEWSGNGLHEHEDIHTVNTTIQITDQAVISGRCLESRLVDHSQKMTGPARATAEKKAVGQRS